MSSSRILSLVALCFVSSLLAVRAAEPVPVAYVINLADDDEDGFAPASCRRADETIEVDDGFGAIAGDVITGGTGATLIAFADGSCVTLDKESQLKIDAYPYPAQRSPTIVSVVSGGAFFSVEPRPDDAHFMVHMREHVIEVKGTKFKVYTQWDAATQTYTSTVSVTQHQVKLMPKGVSAVDIMDGTQVVLTSQHNNIAGFTAPETTLQQKNLTKDQIKALEANSVATAEVTVGNKGDIKIKAMCQNQDGSVTTTTLTEVNGVRTKRTSITKSGKTITEKITEVGTKVTISMTIGNLKLATKQTGASGTSTVKDGNTKDSYKGTVTNIEGGRMIDATCKKTGNRIVIVIRYLSDGSQERIVTKFAKDATTGTSTTTTTQTDGSRKSTIEQVTNTWNGTDFENVAGTQPVGGAATPPTRPPAPGMSTQGTHNLYDPSNPVPVSR